MAEPSWPSPAAKPSPTISVSAGGFDPNDLQDDRSPEKLTITIFGPKDGSKCLSPETRVWTDEGYLSIGSLWDRVKSKESDGNGEWGILDHPLFVQSWNGLSWIKGRVTRIWRQMNSESLLRLTFTNGTHLDCSPSHRFWGPGRWERADSIAAGDRLAAPSLLDRTTTLECSPDVAELMGWQLSEGSESFTYPNYHPRARIKNPRGPNKKFRNGMAHKPSLHMSFTNADPAVLKRIRETAAKAGVLLPRDRGYPPRSAAVIGTNKFARLFSPLGYVFGKKAAQKVIPPSVLRASEEARCRFLAAYFDGDGTVATDGASASFTTASHQMAVSLKEMLLSLGIPSTVHPHEVRLKGWTTPRTYWNVSFGATAIPRFTSRVAIHMVSSEKVQRLQSYSPKFHGKSETVPSSGILSKLRSRGAVGLQFRNGGIEAAYFEYDTSRSGAMRFSGVVGGAGYMEESDLLEQIASPNLIWPTVKSVGTVPYNGYVYDLCVDDTHCYIAEDILVHNSTQAFALPGKKFVLAHDNQSKAARDNFIHKSDPNIHVFKATKFYVESDPKTAIKTLEYTLWALDNAATAMGGQPDWVIVDAFNVQEEIAESFMRGRHNLLPEDSFSNLNFWKARKQYVRAVWRKAMEVARMGVVYVTYATEQVLARENGFPSLSRKAPKYLDVIMQETSITVETSFAASSVTKKNVYKALVMCKKDSETSVYGQMFTPGGETFDITGTTIPWADRMAKYIGLANSGRLAVPVDPAEEAPAASNPVPPAAPTHQEATVPTGGVPEATVRKKGAW